MAKKDRPKMKRPAAVSELLATLFAGTPAGARLREGTIWEVWASVVGDQIASRSRPSSIRDGILTVTVSSAPWLQQLNFLKHQIREKLNEALGEAMVKDIYLKAGSNKDEVPRPVPRAAGKRKVRELSPEEKAEITRATEILTDPQLRETFASLYTKHLANCPP